MSLSIKDLLLRYKARLRAPQGSVIKEVVLAYNALGIPCVETEFGYTRATRTIVIKLTGPKKMEMLMRKDIALSNARKVLGVADAPEHII